MVKEIQNEFEYRRRIVEDTLQAISEYRDATNTILRQIRQKGVSAPSLYACAVEVWSKTIDVLDVLYYGNEPSEITQGIWSKWSMKEMKK